jgi:DNA-binding CsgD family transcriptional regulator
MRASCLTARENEIWRALIGLEIKSRAEVAAALGLTPCRILRLEYSAVKKIAAALGNKSPAA